MKDQQARDGLSNTSRRCTEIQHDLHDLELEVKGIQKALVGVGQMDLSILELVPLTTRVNYLEKKLTALVKHLSCHFEVPDKAPPYKVVQSKES